MDPLSGVQVPSAPSAPSAPYWLQRSSAPAAPLAPCRRRRRRRRPKCSSDPPSAASVESAPFSAFLSPSSPSLAPATARRPRTDCGTASWAGAPSVYRAQTFSSSAVEWLRAQRITQFEISACFLQSWISLDFFGFPWISLCSLGFWNIKKSKGAQRESKEIQRFMFFGFPWISLCSRT